jgi:hypothetical protein
MIFFFLSKTNETSPDESIIAVSQKRSIHFEKLSVARRLNRYGFKTKLQKYQFKD